MKKPRFKNPPARMKGQKGYWEDVLQPLIQNPGRWALIYEGYSMENAQDTADNLSRRLVHIPEPDAEWKFIARMDDVYAKYEPGRKRSASVRGAKRKK